MKRKIHEFIILKKIIMNKSKILTLLCLLFFVGSGFAQLDRSIKPKPGPAPKIQIGNYDSFVLPNGLKVFVVENHKIPKVSYHLLLDYEPVLEGENAGYVDMTGQMLRTGTTTRTKDQLDEEIDFIGATMNTSSDGIFASALKKHNEKLLELMSDVLLNAQFKQEELDKIKKQTISGLEAEKNEATAIAQRVSAAIMYGKDHPYGESATEETVSKVTLDECNNFYKTFFKPNIAYLAVVGDITLAEIKPLVEKYFGNWQKGDVPVAKYQIKGRPTSDIVAIVDRPNAVQSNISVCYPIDLKPGCDDAIKAKVMNTVLGGGTFRLFTNLREKHSYTYGAYSSLNTDRLIGNFNASANVKNPVTDSSFTQILFEMNRLKTEKVSDDELSMIKNYMTGTFSLSLEKPETVANFAINIERYKLPKDYYINYLQNLAAINSDDVYAMASKYLKPENAYIFAVGKASEIADKMKKFNPDGKIKYYDIYGNPVEMEKKMKPIPAGVTAESILKKYVDAIGGEKNLLKVKDLTIKMTTTMQGMSINVDTYKKTPNKLKNEVSSGAMVFQTQLFDGTQGSVTSMKGTEALKDTDLADMKIQAVMNLELYYPKYNIKTNLKGIENINGKDAYMIEVTLPSGTQSTDYYDVESGLKVRSLEKEGETDFSDYKDVNGLKFPYTISQEMGPQTMKLQVASIEMNTKLKDAIFQIKK